VLRVPHAADARHGHFDLLAKRAFPLAPEGTTAGSNPDLAKRGIQAGPG